MKNRLLSFYLILVSMWWGWTFLVDMFIVRTVFSTVSNFFEAGDLGIAVFQKLNNLELIVSSLLIVIVIMAKASKKFLVPTVLCWIIVMTYFSFLTPKIIELTGLWKIADQNGTTGIGGIVDVQQAHLKFHRLYIGLDSLKLVLLTIMITLGLVKAKEWPCEN